MKKIARVFPRKTAATPDDVDVFFDAPGLFDMEYDKVLVSCTFSWDKERAEQLAHRWSAVCADVRLGGPAYDDPGEEFTPGMFLKKGYVFTSRGCPNKCWFCVVPKREGNIRELKIHNGYNVLDSNLLACSDEHIKKVFAMLKRQKERPRFTGGLEAARLVPWMAEELVVLKPASAYFAYDTPDDFEPLIVASKLLKAAGGLKKGNHAFCCYVLIGYKNDTFEKAEKRLWDVVRLGFMPMAMLYERNPESGWRAFQREWANHFIVGTKMKKAEKIIPFSG